LGQVKAVGVYASGLPFFSLVLMRRLAFRFYAISIRVLAARWSKRPAGQNVKVTLIPSGKTVIIYA
jgi:hypothetical protein